MLPDRFHCYTCKRQFDLVTRLLMDGTYWTAADTRVAERATPMVLSASRVNPSMMRPRLLMRSAG